MVSYCVDLTSVYSFAIGKFVLTFVSASVISYFPFKHKRQRLLFGLYERHILIIFHVIFGAPLRFLIFQNSFDGSCLANDRLNEILSSK